MKTFEELQEEYDHFLTNAGKQLRDCMLSGVGFDPSMNIGPIYISNLSV